MSFLTAEPKQLTLRDDGQIYFQIDATNPLPGVPVARLIKGDGYLTPTIDWRDDAPLDGVDLLAATDKIVTWFGLHLARVLGPLVTLMAEADGLPEPVRGICQAVYDGLGIAPRQDLLAHIEKLDVEMRKTLRARHVRLGPVLAFIPDLNKPAAVRLRALLWSIMHDKELPAPVPKDGAVSAVIDPAAADPVFYQAIGYPLYSNRIIRIDMLDRVMNAIYENVKDNQFQAKHQMAEWLGCSVPDLYLVLEAMGHKKTHDPAEVKAVEGQVLADQVAAVALPADSVPDVVAPVEPSPVADVSPAAVATEEPATDATPAVPSAPVPAAKPELATFRVWWPRKGGAKPARAHAHRPRADKAPKTPPPFEYLDPAEIAARQAQGEGDDQPGDKGDRKDWRHKGDDDKGGKERKFNRDDRGGFGDRGRGQKFGGGGGPRKPSKPSRTDKNLRLVSSAAAPASKPEDSPFAALAALKFTSE